MAVSIDFDLLAQAYFCFDEPVPYTTKTGELLIRPISLRDSMTFIYSVGILNIDKNSLPDVRIIQMSYLQFICEKLLGEDKTQRFNEVCLYNILHLCLGFTKPKIKWVKNRPILFDEKMNVEINGKEFDEIKSIILHQNFPHFDDEYINPDLKKAMAETDELKNKEHDSPSLERKMAIITAHTGILKKDQMEMSFRSHSLLFEEVVGEVEFFTVRPPMIARGLSKDVDHWIFKKKKDKFEGYIQSVSSYTQSMGGEQNIKTSDTSLGDSYMQKYNNFN